MPQQKRHVEDKPVTTGEYYPSPLTIEVFADTKFTLEQGYLPKSSLRLMHEHPLFEWVHPDPDGLLIEKKQ